jgi:hypothetical protein
VVHPTSRFVRRVWQLQRIPRAHAFLAYFDDEHVFTEHEVVLPKSASKISTPHGGVDLYFAPHLFRRKRRRNDYALPGRWLYADLDESDPRTLTALPPTVAWETSRGRYQALWYLTKSLGPDELAELNQRVTYFTDADKGGWSLTKVLRVPGSISTKRGDDFKVRLMWWRDEVKYTPQQVQKLTRKVRTPSTVVPELKDLKLPKAAPDRIVRRFNVPGRVRKALRATEARGDRSERLWMLYQDLLSAGMKPEQVLVVVRPTVWNKYSGQRREIKQLWYEINKAAGLSSTSSGNGGASSSKSSKSGRKRTSSSSKRSTKRESDSSKDSGRRDLVGYTDFISQKLKRPGWMVDGIWSESAHGVLAGEAKTYKSVISTDLAVSVASGTPFLNEFDIPSTGPVIMIQEENDPGEFQDRLQRIANSRGLLGSVKFNGQGDDVSLSPHIDLPLHLLNNQGFDLTNKKDMTWLLRQCARR